ncbi:hypothetical protein [Fusobacterium sp. SYSU M8D902]|uniref:hypothetical protein n=1 Tax=Fusobacterium sp. SYSU M8D902 TaxID=3159562 RepID=UPI0032E38347
MARKRVKVDRSETAIPCLIVFTKPLLIAGLPKNTFYLLLGTGMACLFLFKNLVVCILIILLYIFLRKLNEKDYFYCTGLLTKNRKRYISY